MTNVGFEWTDDHRRNHLEAMQTLAQDPEWRRKNKEGSQRRSQEPDWRLKNKMGSQKRSKNPSWKRKNKDAAQIRSKNPTYQCNVKKSNQKLAQNPEWIRKNVESHIGGFWYGNVRYSNSPRYCELWGRPLWHRIDEAQNYQSILSGKTKFENGGRALSRHHVYWQKKACCEWDEDANGYYAWIDTGTARKPDRIKYYIPGDPNKFVLLTKSEHAMVVKDKLKWIKIFEDLIETKLGGVCYLPKVI